MIYVWAEPSKVYHQRRLLRYKDCHGAEHRGPDCGVEVGPEWRWTAKPPKGRRLCRRCQRCNR